MNTMLSRALREFMNGPLKQLIVNLGGNDGDQWEEQLKQFLRKEPCWSNGQVAQAPAAKPRTSLLELVSTVVVPATSERFVAKDKFVVNTKGDAPVMISYLNDNFTKWFLSGEGLTENPISEQTLRCAKPRRSSRNGPIIKELGGAENAEMTLIEVFSLMEKQKYGEKGVLQNNGRTNVFYIKNQLGVLCSVDVDWSFGGWTVGADLIDDPDIEMSRVVQVFSRNPVPGPSEPSAPAQVPSGASAT